MELRHLAAITGLLFATTLAAFAATADASEGPGTITVSGEGSVAAAPDMATLRLGVNRRADTAAEALAEASRAAAEVLAQIEDAGIASRDVQTSGLTLGPVWSPRRNDGERRIIGYEAGNSLNVRVRDLDLLGGLLDTVVSVGADSFGGLSFGLADPDPLMDAAREAAVADAQHKARLYATAAGVELGALHSLSEEGYARLEPMMMRAEMDAAGGVPIAEGEVEVTARVQMVYTIAQ